MAEKLRLRWNAFQEDFSKKIGRLKEEPDCADVTLACEDGTQVEAHRVVVAACSPSSSPLTAPACRILIIFSSMRR